jgi:hypothetical protein
MSQVLHGTINESNVGTGTDDLPLHYSESLSTPFSPASLAQIGDDLSRPQLAQLAPNPASYSASNFVDGSGQIFSMYLEMATEEDKKMVENWKADADGILIFVRPSLLVSCFRLT